jgi:hypothetical protein
MVEHFPLIGPTEYPMRAIKRRFNEILRSFAKGEFKTEGDIVNAIDLLEYHWPPRWEFIKQFRTDELECNVFGHVCPVFFTWEAATETKTYRKHSRTIPHEVMLKVVRRDNGICQICSDPVPDNEVQFDHLIPYSRGGPASVENLRLVHARCNKRKRDLLSEILEPAR